MKTLLTLLLLLPLLTTAQDRKTIKKRSTYFVEEMEVLANDKTTRNGTYRKRFRDNDVLLEQGQYAANQRVGVWTFYGHTGEPELIYDYTKKEFIKRRVQRAASTAQLVEGDSIVNVRLDEGPTYLASTYQIYGVLGRTARFPVNLQRAGINQLSFRVLATVSPAGNTYRILPSNPDKEFVNASKMAANTALEGIEWVPAVYEQKPVTATYLFEEVVLTGYSVTNTTLYR